MMTFLRRLLVGDKRFMPYSGEYHQLHCGRIHMILSWTRYSRYRGMFLSRRFREGVMKCKLFFNPGLPPMLFAAMIEAFNSDDDDTQFMFIQAGSDLESMLETGALEENWQCSSIVRNSQDLQFIYDWIDNLKEMLKQREMDPLDKEEHNMLGHVMSRLTEDLSTCQLNS